MYLYFVRLCIECLCDFVCIYIIKMNNKTNHHRTPISQPLPGDVKDNTRHRQTNYPSTVQQSENLTMPENS